MKFISFFILTFSILALADKSEPKSHIIKVKLDFHYKEILSPFKLYELDASDLKRLGEVKNVKNLDAVTKIFPSMSELKDRTVDVQRGFYKVLLLVMQNDSDKPVYFAAGTHSFEPAEEALGLKFICLCFGETFRVKAKHVWYRVLQLKANDYSLAKEIKITHEIVGLPRSQVILRDGEYK